MYGCSLWCFHQSKGLNQKAIQGCPWLKHIGLPCCLICKLAAVYYPSSIIQVGLSANNSRCGSLLGSFRWHKSCAHLQITIARACQVAFTGLFCLFLVIGLFPICLLRATMGPGVGIFSNLGFGITIIQGQFSWAPHHGYQLLWKDVRPESCLLYLTMFSSEAACP